MAYGLHAVEALLESGAELNRLLVVRDRRDPALRALMADAHSRGIPVQEVPREKLDGLVRGTHQGVIALRSPVEYQPLDAVVAGLFEQGRVPMLVLLDGVTDVRNLGAIARTAQASGAHAVVIPRNNSAQVTSDALKASAGALASLPVCRVASLPEAATYLLGCGFQLVGATERGVQPYEGVDFTGPLALVMGGEESGISPNLMRKCGVLACIPMPSGVGSLNVSVAAGVFLFEAARQRRSESKAL
jgi:23S rRNA (guanosine2251-2'-O)-methyltransferase